MKFTATITGDIQKLMLDDVRSGERAVRRGVAEVTDNLKNRLRQQVRSAGLGGKLANGIRGQVYPRSDSLGAAGVVFARPGRNKSPDSGAAGILRSFEEGLEIRARGGKFLAIPSERVPKGTRRTYQQILEKYRDHIVMIPRRSGGGWYVFVEAVRSKSKAGFRVARGKRAYARREKFLLFTLVPLTRMKKRLDWKSEGDRAINELVPAIEKAWTDG